MPAVPAGVHQFTTDGTPVALFQYGMHSSGRLQVYSGGSAQQCALLSDISGGSVASVVATPSLGATAATQGSFVVVDAAFSTSSNVSVQQLPGPYTGKGTRADEAEMDVVSAFVVPASGSATVYWRSGTFVIGAFRFLLLVS